MSLDFSKIKEKSIVNKSYSESVDDKFKAKPKKDAEVSKNENTTILKSKEELSGWSLSGNQVLEIQKEVLNGQIISSEHYIHPRIKEVAHYEGGNSTHREYLLDNTIQLRVEHRKADSSKEKKEHLTLHLGDELLFERFYYKNGSSRETFLDNNTEDVRYLSIKGELISVNGVQKHIPYDQKQTTFYPSKELNELLTSFKKTHDIGKNELICKILVGTIEPHILEEFQNRCRELGITDQF
jgi:hypothetical protein